jgi:cobalt-zinc-cadmium resistance protein CzcA
VLCAWFMRKGVREKRNKAFEWIKERYIRGLDYSLAHPWKIVGATALGLS